MVALTRNGDSWSALLTPFNARSHYADGLNLYLYLGGNPINGLDALGLDYFDDIDNLIDDRIGHALYTLGALNEGAKMAALGLKTSLTVASIVLGLDVLDSVKLLASGKGGFWEALDVVASINPIGRFGKIGGKIGKAFGWLRKGKRSGRIAGSALELLFKRCSYGEARGLVRGFSHKIEAHKLLEWRHVQRLGLNLKKSDIPAVILPRGMHRDLTTVLQRRLKKGRTHDPVEILRVYERVYVELGHPEWIEDVRRYLQ